MLRSVVFMGIVLMVVLSLFGFFQSPFFEVTELEVGGMVLLEAEEVRTMLDLRGQQHIFSVSLGELESRVASDPRVKDVSVRRQLPGRLVVQVRERQPVAVISRGGVFALINRDGKVIAVESSWPGMDLPVLGEVQVDDLSLGRTVDSPEVDELLQCADLLGDMSHRISQMMREEGYISLHTTEAAHILFPVNGEDARKAADVLSNIMDEGRLEAGSIVDLRIPERPVMRSSAPR